MGAVLDTINGFSATLSQELAEMVKTQDEETVAALIDIATTVSQIKEDTAGTLQSVDEIFTKDVTAAMKKRRESINHLMDSVEGRFNDVIKTIEEMKASLAP